MKIDIEHGSNEWKDLRKKKVTSTDSSVILGVNPYCTPNLLWKRKMGLEPEQADDFRMSEGRRMEPEALQAFTKEIGLEFYPGTYQNPNINWQMASLDGMSDCGLYIVEIKCSMKILQDAYRNIIDPMYYAQCHHHMCVTGIRSCYFFAYWNGDFMTSVVHWDDDYMKKLLEREEEFYDWMQTFKEPPLTDKDYRIVNDTQWYNTAQMYREAAENIKYWQMVEDKCREDLIRMSDNHSTMGCGVKLTKYTERGRIDYKNVIAAHPEINWESFRKSDSERWRISNE